MIRRYSVIERGGLRFGLFGVLGKEAMIYTSGGATTFADPIESAKEVVRLLRETEKVDLVIALSHGGVVKGADGRYTDGEDVRLAKDVPGVDVVIGGHSHTELQEAIIVNGRTPVVQTGKESRNLGELVIAVDGDRLTVESYRLYPIDDTSPAIAQSQPRSKHSRSPSAQRHLRRAGIASTSRWPSRHAICRMRTRTSLPERSWPTSSPTRFAKPPRRTSASPPTA